MLVHESDFMIIELPGIFNTLSEAATQVEQCLSSRFRAGHISALAIRISILTKGIIANLFYPGLYTDSAHSSELPVHHWRISSHNIRDL